MSPLETELLAALKECALHIAQNHNRKLTFDEQNALAWARDVIAKAETRTIKLPSGFITDCLESECDIGTYSNGRLTASPAQLAELRSRACHYESGGTDGSSLWLIHSARILLRHLDQAGVE